MRNKNFPAYNLLKDSDMEDVEFVNNSKQNSIRKRFCMTTIILLIICFIALVLIFVVFPIVFMNSKTLQTSLIFTRFNLPRDRKTYEEAEFPAYRNRYVTFTYPDKENQTLGLWHILPIDLAYDEIYKQKIDFDKALLNSNYSVLIYFHGTGETRSYNQHKYNFLSNFFHVIAFDYRGYGDSSNGEMTESKVVGDCVELYKWVRNRTNSGIYVWGHSLGAAIATETLSILENEVSIKPKALIIESAFTNLCDELYVHPLTKFFAWLPWFAATVVEPLRKTGLIFDTEKHLLTITCPVMILHAEDDNQIPYIFGQKLNEVGLSRNITTVYHQFKADLNYKHNTIYQDPFLKYFLRNFIESIK